MTRKASTLAEVVLALALLALLVLILFVILDISTRAFQRSLVEHSMQADTQRVAYRLSEDLRRSHLFTISNIETKVAGFHRDILCLAGVRDWSQPDAINSVTNRPDWDRYILYYCRRSPSDRQVAALFRCWILPKKPEEMGSFSFPSLNPALHCRPDPSTVSEVEAYTMLSNLVEEFDVEEAQGSQYRVRFRLRQARARREAGRWIDAVLETTVQVRPENTFPVY